MPTRRPSACPVSPAAGGIRRRCLPGPWWVFLFLLLGRPCPAADLPEWAPGELGYSVRLWTVEDGVPANFIDWLCQTPDGYIWWPATWGAVRFDGVGFRSFYPPDGREGGRAIEGVFRASDGKLWVWDWRQGVAVWGPGGFRPLPPAPGRTQASGVIEAPDGSIWLTQDGEDGRGLLRRLDGDSGETLPVPATSLFALRVHVDERRQVWLWRGGTILLSTPTGLEPAPMDPPGADSNSFSMFVRLPDGSTGVVGPRGLHVLLGDRWVRTREFPTPLPAGVKPQAAALDGLGNVWIGTRFAGLWRVAADNRVGRVTLPGLVFPDGFGIGAVVADREDNVWVGSRGGLYQIQRALFRRALAGDLLDESEPIDIAEGPGGDFWVVTESGLVLRYPSDGGGAVPVGGPGRVRSVEAAGDGTVWFGGPGGLWRWTGGASAEQVPPPGASSGAVGVGRLFRWGGEVATALGAQVWALRADGPVPLLSDGAVEGGRQVVISANGSGSGLALVPGVCLFAVQDGGVRRQVGPGPDRQRGIWLLHVDPEGRAWSVGAQPPLMRFVDGAWSEAPLGDFEMPVDVLAVESDSRQGLWGLTAAHGVFRIPREFGSDGSDGVQWFGAASGLPSNAGRGWGQGITRSQDGRIWVATARGVGVVDPGEWEAARDAIGPPRVHVESVLLNDRPADPQPEGRVIVPPGDVRLEIRFTALGLNNAAENRFRYRLSGVDDTERDAGRARAAVYHRLPPGTHEFHVTAANSFGTWSPRGATLQVVVVPAWWRRAGVQAAGGLLAVGIGASLVRLRLRHLERRRVDQERFSRELIRSQEDERRRIAGELHDGLGQNLLAAKNLALLASIQTGTAAGAPSSPERFREISESIGEAIDEVRSISRALRPPELDHLGLTKAIRALVARAGTASGMEMVDAIDDVDGELTPGDEINFYRLLQEALSNAMKHSGARTVRLAVGRGAGGIRAEIADDGCGFDPVRIRQQGRAGLGLLGMEERARLMHGRLEVASAPGTGTRVTITIPNRRMPT